MQIGWDMESENKQEYKKAIEYILSLLKDKTLKVGDRLPTERGIAHTLSISRNSIREALSVLNGMGIIERRQGSGNYVSKNLAGAIQDMIRIMLAVDSTTKEDICSFRRYMDKMVCMAILERGMDEKCTLQMQMILEKMEIAENADIAALDENFHRNLILATENSFWITIMDAVIGVYREWIDRVLEKADVKDYNRLLKSHSLILSGLIENRQDLCMYAIDSHYDIIDRLLKNRKQL